ncbi:MAG: hypothetical protein K0U10_03635 [Gammaproteobacteria bacterium]|nr:hypothetical protein [Gammaproteobacteria bacterium]
MPAEYKVIDTPELVAKVNDYIAQVRASTINMGQRLVRTIETQGLNISTITAEQFLDCILKTKEPRLFAEVASHVLTADPTKPNWNKPELDILGDIVIATDDVKFYDNGHWTDPTTHIPPLDGGLLFVAGALLKPEHSPDRDDIVLNSKSPGMPNTIDRDKLKALYARRLLPAFIHANEDAGNKGVKGFINVPGLGCGEFAGDVKDAVCAIYPDVINEIIQENIGQFPNIGAFYIASPGAESRKNITGKVDVLFGSPFSALQQLDAPDRHGKKYVGHKPYKVVAADHASWPCNDWYVASRLTDEGVIGAATSAMQAMTGFGGVYSPTRKGFIPPSDYANWEAVVKSNKLTLDYNASTIAMVHVDTHQAGAAAADQTPVYQATGAAAVSTVGAIPYVGFTLMRDGNYFLATSNVEDATQIAKKLADINILGGSGNKFPGPHTSFAGGSNPTGIILTLANIETMMGVDKDTRMTQESIESALASLFSLAKPSPNLSAAGPGHSGP